MFVCQATLETVARVKPKKNDTKEEKYMRLSSEPMIMFFLFNRSGSE